VTVTGAFESHFSDCAAQYAAYRPRYPLDLIEHVARAAPSTRLAWDCGTGNGQAAHSLAGFFDRVVATDPSAEQLAAAASHERVRYERAAERCASLGDATVDLVTVAQALHWIDLDVFYAEVRRVLAPRGVLAVWTYLRPRITPVIDAVIDWFHDDRVGAYWPAERKHVDTGYRSLPFPYPELPPQNWAIAIEMPREAFVGYVSTWSSVQRALRTGDNALPAFEDRITQAWGNDASRTVTWPIVLRMGRRDDR
jgi:SAM-dependent methyltransferase